MNNKLEKTVGAINKMSGFTLIELITMISVGGVLIGLLLPAIQK